MSTPVFTKTTTSGKHLEVFAMDGSVGECEFSVMLDGKRFSTGTLVAIDRKRPDHKNAPAGTTHLIGKACFVAEDGSVLEVIAEAGTVANLGALEAAQTSYWSKVEAAGISRKTAESLLNRWGRDGLQTRRAYAAEAMADYEILQTLERVG